MVRSPKRANETTVALAEGFGSIGCVFAEAIVNSIFVVVVHVIAHQPTKMWYADWDLAFHAIPLSTVDLEFAKEHLDLRGQRFYSTRRKGPTRRRRLGIPSALF